MIDHFSFLAPVYDRVMGAGPARRLLNVLDLPFDGRLLDAGGGTGRVSAGLGLSPQHIVVVDTSRPMLRNAARKKLRAVAAMSEHLPFPDAAFDRVIVVDALHHFRDQQAAVRDFARVLKPGGRMVVEEPDITLFAVKMAAAAERLALMDSLFHTRREIEAMMAAAGLAPRTRGKERFRVWITGDKQAPAPAGGDPDRTPRN